MDREQSPFAAPRRLFPRGRGLSRPAALALLILAAVFGRLSGPAWAGSSQATGATITYPAGWNLVALPAGTDFSQISGPLYIYAAGSYEMVQSGQTLPSDTGFWVDFAAQTTVLLGAGSAAATSAGLRPQQWVMLGDPSGTEPAYVNGATAYTYDPLNGYQPLLQGSALLPGKGVWVTPAPGSNAVIMINPGSSPAGGLSSYSLTSPCASALATQGYTSEGNGETIGNVDGQVVSVCLATGPQAVDLGPVIGCLLAGSALTTLDGGPACASMGKVVPQGADRFLWINDFLGPADSVTPLSWNGSGFRSGPSNVSVQLASDVPDAGRSLQAYGSLTYIACETDVAQPVASADQCNQPQAVPASAPSLPTVTLPIQPCNWTVAHLEPIASAVSATLVAPAGFACTGFIAGDGGLSMTLYGPDDPCYSSPTNAGCPTEHPSESVGASFRLSGAGTGILLACPYFTPLQTAGRASFPECSETLPPGQFVQPLDANSVAFYQPADDTNPSPTFGIVVSNAAATDGRTTGSATEATCTMPAGSASVCESVLTAFLTGWGQSYDPAAGSAAAALGSLNWFSAGS